MNVRVVMYRVQYQPERQDRADDATARESARTLEKINSAAKRFFSRLTSVFATSPRYFA
jgi:hypothetical protein